MAGGAIAAVFGWLVFDEPITWALLLALTLVAIGIVLVNRKAAPT